MWFSSGAVPPFSAFSCHHCEDSTPLCGFTDSVLLSCHRDPPEFRSLASELGVTWGSSLNMFVTQGRQCPYHYVENK